MSTSTDLAGRWAQLERDNAACRNMDMPVHFDEIMRVSSARGWPPTMPHPRGVVFVSPGEVHFADFTVARKVRADDLEGDSAVILSSPVACIMARIPASASYNRARRIVSAVAYLYRENRRVLATANAYMILAEQAPGRLSQPDDQDLMRGVLGHLGLPTVMAVYRPHRGVSATVRAPDGMQEEVYLGYRRLG